MTGIELFTIPAAAGATGAASAGTVITLGDVLLATGAIASGVGAVASGVQAANQAKAQATVQKQQAVRERQIAEGEERDFRRRISAAKASGRAKAGGLGRELGGGSFVGLQEDLASEAELQALRIRSGGQARSTRLEQQASLNIASGRAQRTAGFIRGGSSLLSPSFNKAFQ